jgi:signal transduction histidine kinase
VRRLSGVGVRLSLAAFGVVAVALGIVYAIAVPSLEDRLVGSRVSQLRNAAAVAVVKLPANRFAWPDFLETTAASLNARVVIYDAVGPPTALVVTGDSTGVSSADVEDDPMALRSVLTLAPASGTVTTGDEPFAEAAEPFAGGTSVLLVRSSLQDALQTVAAVRERLLLAGGIALLVALVGGYCLAQLFARRLRRLERAAERIASGSFDEAIADTSTDEVGDLARTFDRMRERLATLDHARREFIANASHELRTPIFTLGGFLELLADEELDDETRREFVATMQEQVERLTKLASELLDLSRMDAGRLRVERERVDLSSVAETLTEEFAAVAVTEQRPLTFEGEGSPAVADEQRVLQIGRILLDNAFVHTPPGTPVTVRAAVERGDAVLVVEDAGPGIPAEHVANVFERFYRVEGAIASGSGLGLAIARQLAELMAGRIEVDSEPGRTRFSLMLPLAEAEPALAPLAV